MRRVGAVLLVLYLAALTAIAVWPTPVDRPFGGTLAAILARLRAAGFGVIDYDVVESASNALLFLPFGLLLAGLLGRGRRWLALGVCLAATLAIEFLQKTLLPERTADVRDLLANSIGAVLGIAAVSVAERLRRRRRVRGA